MAAIHPRFSGTTWMAQLAPFGPVTISTDTKGSREASWSFYARRGERPRVPESGLVELMVGSLPLYAGTVAEVDWAENRVTAHGLSAGAENFNAVDGSNNATATPSVAVDQAITRGWDVLGRQDVPTTAYTASADGLNSVGALLDSNVDELGQRWWIAGDRQLRVAADATDPDWHIAAGLVEMGVANDDYFSGILVAYKSSVSVVSKTFRQDVQAARRFGAREVSYDATALGVITLARAQAIGDGLLAKGRARLGWTQPITVTAEQITNNRGVKADLRAVQALQVARVFGGYDDLRYLDGRTHLDVVIGQTDHLDGSGLITISPLGSVSQTLDEAFAEVVRRTAA